MKKVCARGVVIHNGSVLLIYRENKGNIYHTIPGGKKKNHETLEQTVKREILEETCVDIKVTKYLGFFTNDDDERDHHLFLCEYLNGVPKLGESEEKDRMKKDNTNFYEPKWVDLESAKNLKIKPQSCEEFFKSYLTSMI